MLVFLFFCAIRFQFLARAKVENAPTGERQGGEMIAKSVRINNQVIFA
jgi:hypothetical protein